MAELFIYDTLYIEKLPVGELATNCYIVYKQGSTSVTVIDPGAEANKIIQELSGKNIDSIILTHGHFDHISAVDELVNHFDCKVFVSLEDEEMLTDSTKNVSSQFASSPVLVQAHAIPYAEGEEILSSGLTFKAMRTPGHTLGSSCLVLNFGSHHLMFTGDTLFKGGYGRTDLYGGSFSTMVKSARRLLSLTDYYICFPGHGLNTSIGLQTK